jgi:hypothetical protein
MKPHRLPIEDILLARMWEEPAGEPALGGAVVSGMTELGRSRGNRPIYGWTLGRGSRRISLIGGAHADEPIGPLTLEKLVGFLGRLHPEHPLLREWKWRIVPHINPDGAEANAAWTGRTVPVKDSRGAEDCGYLLSAYLDGAVREPPGEDLEFGFPSDPADEAGHSSARPEACAVAAFLRAGGPYALHASLHGMAFGTGPWFLLERTWVERTRELRRRLVKRVEQMGYLLHDVDRHGEKGFTRIAQGFCTRPDSDAMRRHFLERNEPETAGLFRPSSMELARSFGGDPLTIVSEMPLFLVPHESLDREEAPPMPLDPERRKRFSLWVEKTRRAGGWAAVDTRAERMGIHPMARRDQMRLQLAFLDEAMEAASTHSGAAGA